MVVDRAKGRNLGAASSTFAIGLDLGLAGGGALMGQVLELTNFPTFFIMAGSFSLAAAVILATVTLRERTSALAPAAAAGG
jgi:predicted MFS family arabinose efflux permease